MRLSFCLLFVVVLCYAAGFFAGFGVPKDIDDGSRAAVPAAVAVDLFGLRQAWLHARHVRYSPPFTERGIYGRIRHPGRHRIRRT